MSRSLNTVKPYLRLAVALLGFWSAGHALAQSVVIQGLYRGGTQASDPLIVEIKNGGPQTASLRLSISQRGNALVSDRQLEPDLGPNQSRSIHVSVPPPGLVPGTAYQVKVCAGSSCDRRSISIAGQ